MVLVLSCEAAARWRRGGNPGIGEDLLGDRDHAAALPVDGRHAVADLQPTV